MKKFSFLIIILSLYVSCNSTQNSSRLKNLINRDTKKNEEILNSKKEEFKNIDSNFNNFIKFFSIDSLFQMDRVQFPITIKYKDWEKDNEYTEEIIPKQNYTTLNFEYNDSYKTRKYDEYNQKIKVIKNKATIEIRGINNGISGDFYFERINGKWMLITWTDSST